MRFLILLYLSVNIVCGYHCNGSRYNGVFNLSRNRFHKNSVSGVYSWSWNA